MASASPLKDIDEQFLQCCICMEQLKEPKMLPCLHRYCRGCLKKVFKEVKKIECPTCREEHILPEGGIDELKTDFNTKNIIEFIQLQESVKKEPMKVCAGCARETKASAYCFKCNDFLCQACHAFHTVSKIVKDHLEHILSLSDAEARNLTIQKLSSMREAPRCQKHPGKLSELCCTTCDNLPICVPCTYGAHQGHNLKEVSSLAQILRDQLKSKMAGLMQYKERTYITQEKIRKTRDKLVSTAGEERKRLQDMLDAEEDETERKLKETETKLQKKRAELDEELARTTSQRKQELEKEMREANQKYERACAEERQEAEVEFRKLQQEIERENEQLQTGLDSTNNNIKELLTSLKSREEENTRRIGELSDSFDDIVKRFETVTTIASSILAAKHDWTDAQCIPDICRAIDALPDDVGEDFPELETLWSITTRATVPLTSWKGKVEISEREESVVDIKGIHEGWIINDITSSKDCSIIVTGRALGKQSHITAVERNGRRLGQKILQSTHRYPYRYCSTLPSQSKVASVSHKNEVGIYDIKGGTYKMVHTSMGSVTSVAVDPTDNMIIVGGRANAKLCVFTDQLQYNHSLTLPNEIRNPFGIAVHVGNLLVCDNINRRAYAITMDGQESKLVFEFTKPGNAEGYRPCSVCTDRNGFIYMVWVDEARTIIAQYSPKGGRLLATRRLDDEYYAVCITTVDTEEGEKMLMATRTTGKLITFSLQ